jgi:hypothetical protein
MIMPSIEYIKIKRSRRPPMLASEWRVITNVLKMSLKLLPLLIRRRRRRILKLLKIVMTPLISSEVFAEMKILRTDPRIMTVSNIFQPSEK